MLICAWNRIHNTYQSTGTLEGLEIPKFSKNASVFEICENEFLIIEFEAWTFWTDFEQNFNMML